MNMMSCIRCRWDHFRKVCFWSEAAVYWACVSCATKADCCTVDTVALVLGMEKERKRTCIAPIVSTTKRSDVDHTELRAKGCLLSGRTSASWEVYTFHCICIEA